MKPRGLFHRLAAVVAGLGLALAAQAPKPAPAGTLPRNSQTPIIIHNVNEVSVVFTAVDKHQRFITGLKEPEVEVLDSQRPQKILNFVRQGDVPLRIALLIDTSNSIRDRWDFEQQAAIDFLQSVLQPGRDKAMVEAFDSAPQTIVDFTDDLNQIAEGIHKLRPGGGTALYDALVTAVHDKMQPSASIARNVIVIISDGEDDQSRYSADEALTMAENAGAVIFTVSTESFGTDPQDDKMMSHFADVTGGRSFFPIDTNALPKAFASITTELHNEYVVSYQPDNLVANGAFHPVQIKILLKDISARARKGYYAPPAGAS